MQRGFSEKEIIILKALAKTLYKKRQELQKSQRLIAFEYDIQKSMISRLESCTSEPKLFSLWRIANMFDLKLSELITLIELELPEYISLIEK